MFQVFAKTVPGIFTFGFKKNNQNANNSDKSEEQLQSNYNNSAGIPTTPPNLASTIPIPKQAHNFDLTIWGVPLHLAAQRSDPRGLVPLPMLKAISFVEAHGLDVCTI